MRLSDESTAKFEIELVNKQIQKIKQAINNCQTHYGKQLGCGTCKALQLCTWTKELIDTIEAMRKHIKALQKENNGWQERYYELDAGHSRLFKDFCKLQQENEQLRTQINEGKKMFKKLTRTKRRQTK